MSSAFLRLGYDKPASQYRRFLSEQERGERDVLVAFVDGEFAGYATIVWRSGYGPFYSENVPEIKDLNGLFRFRRRGVATRLMDEAEGLVFEKSLTTGIGVGMTLDYGAAERRYVKHGYMPDGRSLMSPGKPVEYGKPVVIDDDLVLYFTKDPTRQTPAF